MSFRVELKPSGHAFQVAAGEPVLRSGLDAGFSMPYSCQTGVCRTCRGRILEGKVDYGMVHPTYLPDSDKEKGYALLCQASPLTDLVIEVAEVGGLENIRPRIVPCRVIRIARPAADVAVLTLRLPMNENMLFVAGQTIDLLLADGKRRSYSIASAPSPDGVTEIELHVRHMPGGLFTDHVFGKMKERELLRFEGPLGTFHLRAPSGKPAVLLASGTGFAPIKSMCEDVFRRGLSPDQPLILYWGCRRRADQPDPRWGGGDAAAGPSGPGRGLVADRAGRDHGLALDRRLRRAAPAAGPCRRAAADPGGTGRICPGGRYARA